MHVFWNENVISYNLTIITRIFSAYKIDRKIRIFSLGLKNNIFIHKKESIWSYHVCCDRTFVPKRVHFFFTSCKKTAGKSRGLLIEPVAEPGEGPPPSPLIFKANWGPKSEKIFFGDRGPPYLRVWMTTSPASPLIWRSGSTLKFSQNDNWWQIFVSFSNRRFMHQASRMRQFVIKKIRLPLRGQMH